MTLAGTPAAPELDGDAAFPVNNGALCIKGWTAGAALAHPERLTTPLIRGADGILRAASWDEALGRIAAAFRETRAAYGADAVGVFGGGSLTNEKSYLLGKFARVALQTASIDYNGRFCMSSAAAAGIRALGVDRGLPFPLADLAGAEVILLTGGNPAETMPPLMQYFERQRAAGGKLIVADPRLTPTGQRADLHLRLIPGTDAALANGLLHILIRDGLTDAAYIAERTAGFDAVRNLAATYWPERVERITGVPESRLLRAARMLGAAQSAMILTGRGAEQQRQGTGNVLSFINIALALGLVGRPRSGYGCLTGQGNGQGGREHGQKADQLPGYRLITDPAARRHIAGVWGVAEADLPGPGRSAYEMLDTLGQEGGVRALLVMGSNVAVSAPRSIHIAERLRALDFLAVSDFFLSETAALADVVLPAAQWAEESGTMTNLEGRVIRRRRVFAMPDGVRDDIAVICALAQRLGKGEYFPYIGGDSDANSDGDGGGVDTAAIFDELGRASAGGVADYSGISYGRIDAEDGVFWPCPGVGHPGTPRMFVDGFPTADGRARFHPVRHGAPAEEPDGEYPLWLTTGRNLAQYQSGTQTRRIGELRALAPWPAAELHPVTARRYGVADGAAIVLASRRGTAHFTARLTRGIREDTVFAPFHWGGQQAVNRLTNPALDPVSRMPEFKAAAVRIESVAAAEPVESVDGVSGIDGIDRVDGVDGVSGIDGVDGVDGVDGIDGTEGTT